MSITFIWRSRTVDITATAYAGGGEGLRPGGHRPSTMGGLAQSPTFAAASVTAAAVFAAVAFAAVAVAFALLFGVDDDFFAVFFAAVVVLFAAFVACVFVVFAFAVVVEAEALAACVDCWRLIRPTSPSPRLARSA